MSVSGRQGGPVGQRVFLPSCRGRGKGEVHGCDACGGGGGSRKDSCFFAGDFRVNEHLNLIVLHTVFARCSLIG